MTEHKNAQYLRALADGKAVQAKHKELCGGVWVAVTLFDVAMASLVSGNDTGWQFRIAPETITITLASGEARTINAPLREAPKDGAAVWYVSAGDVCSTQLSNYPGSIWHLFTDEKDAQAWADLQREILWVKK